MLGEMLLCAILNFIFLLYFTISQQPHYVNLPRDNVTSLKMTIDSRLPLPLFTFVYSFDYLEGRKEDDTPQIINVGLSSIMGA